MTPLSVTTCGLFPALSVNVATALRFPAAVGVNVTFTVQEALAARFAPVQVSLPLAKSPGFVPPSATILTVRLAEPVLVSAIA